MMSFAFSIVVAVAPGTLGVGCRERGHKTNQIILPAAKMAGTSFWGWVRIVSPKCYPWRRSYDHHMTIYLYNLVRNWFLS